MIPNIVRHSRKVASIAPSATYSTKVSLQKKSTQSAQPHLLKLSQNAPNILFENRTLFASYTTQTTDNLKHLNNNELNVENKAEQIEQENASQIDKSTQVAESSDEQNTQGNYSVSNEEKTIVRGKDNPWEFQDFKKLYSPQMPLEEMFKADRSQREVILDFTTYILPNLMKLKSPYLLLGKYLKSLEKNHPQSVLIIYDELDQNVKKKYFLYFADAVCSALISIGKPEVVQRLLKNRENEAKSFALVKVRVIMNVQLGKYNEAIKILDTFSFPSKSEKYSIFVTLLEELIKAKQGQLVKSVYDKYRSELFIPTPKFIKLIELLLENECINEAKQISKSNTSRILVSLEKGVITKKDVDALEAKLKNAEAK